MSQFNPEILRKLYVPAPDSHKGQNGKLLLIGGSRLFHAASLWPLTVASRLLDMVFFSSVPENNAIIEKAKEEFRNGIVVPRGKLENYIEESDVILIGPGLPRPEGQEEGDDDTKKLTEGLLQTYPEKRWVIDGGSLQTMDPEVLLKLKTKPILTPHPKEFEILFGEPASAESVSEMAQKYSCIIVLKGMEDVVASPTESVSISGGNAGMTKGGTGDVLAGLIAALYTKNEAFLSATAGSYINKKAGEALAQTMGLYFNAEDLALQIPKTMKELI